MAVFRVEHPENAALPVAAWLVAQGDRAAALELLEAIGPYADRLRFVPHRARPQATTAGQVHRRTVDDVRRRLTERWVQPQVEAQREALRVWLPLTDRFVALWWGRRAADGSVGEGWTSAEQAAAADLVVDYDTALLQHRRCRKHRDPKENLPILVAPPAPCSPGRSPSLSAAGHSTP